jgi:hypothetical protein
LPIELGRFADLQPADWQHSKSIIFVHGLTGDREETWTAKNAVAPWPQTLLPAQIPSARVLTFGYDAYVADWRGMVSTSRIGNHSMNLLTAVATYREKDDTIGFSDLYLGPVELM